MFGQVFTTLNCGDVIVCDYINYDNVWVTFFDTGHVLKTKKDVLTRSERPRLKDPLAKTVFGVGCIGIGKHKAHVKGSDTTPYSIWRAMLRRCYNDYEQRAYRVGGTVCDEWLNYQTFADWYVLNHPNDGERYQLDKDIRVKGNKRYSPDTCLFVTQQENLDARSFNGGEPRRPPRSAYAVARLAALNKEKPL